MTNYILTEKGKDQNAKIDILRFSEETVVFVNKDVLFIEEAVNMGLIEKEDP